MTLRTVTYFQQIVIICIVFNLILTTKVSQALVQNSELNSVKLINQDGIQDKRIKVKRDADASARIGDMKLNYDHDGDPCIQIFTKKMNDGSTFKDVKFCDCHTGICSGQDSSKDSRLWIISFSMSTTILLMLPTN